MSVDHQPWMAQAECVDLTALMFPGRGDNAGVDAARAVCARCPVRVDCLEYALDNDEHYGVWGGTSERERRRMRKARREAA